MIEIGPGLSIPEEELRFVASRAGGPGGQHVNKVNTRITIFWDLAGSTVVSESQRRRIASRLATRVGRDGTLRVACGRHRSQAANRREAADRLRELVREALRPRRARKPTRVPVAAKRKRLESKRRRSAVKRDRRSVGPE